MTQMTQVTQTTSKHNEWLINNISKREDLFGLIKSEGKYFDKFAKTNEKFLHKIVNKFSPKNIFDYEDLFQIAIFSLYNIIILDKYDSSRSAFSTFAFTCIFNDVLQEINKRNKIEKAEASLDSYVESYGDSVDLSEVAFNTHDNSFENTLIVQMQIEEFMKSLEPIHKDIFDRRVIKKMKHKDVAEDLGLNYHTYKHIWHYSVSPKIKNFKNMFT